MSEEQADYRASPLTYMEKRVYQFVTQYWREHYNSPSMREISDGIGINSTSTVYELLARLRDRGLMADRKYCASRYAVPDWVREAIKRAKPAEIV